MKTKYPTIVRPIYGTCVRTNLVPEVKEGIIEISGTCRGAQTQCCLNKEMLHRGVLTIGGTGCGKTTLLKMCTSQLRKLDNYSMVVLEVKKDYQEDLYREGDLFLGQGEDRSKSVHPNIFEDLLIDGWDESSIKLNCMEFAKQLFADLKNQAQQFFPDAATILLYEVLLLYINEAKHSLVKRNNLSNKGLVDYFCQFNQSDYKKLLEQSQDPGILKWLLGDGKSTQALGVLGETVLQVISTFVDVFAEKGNFSVRRFIRNKQNNALFLQYDPAFKESQKRIFNVLINLVFKEVLSHHTSKGNVIFVCDELAAIGKIDLSSIINLGRSKGFICLAGIQSVAQLEEIYNETEASTILAGFGSKICFNVFEARSLRFIKEVHGENMVEEIRLSPGGNTFQRCKGYVVEEDVILGLKTGECVMGLVGYDPFIFEIDKGEL